MRFVYEDRYDRYYIPSPSPTRRSSSPSSTRHDPPSSSSPRRGRSPSTRLATPCTTATCSSSTATLRIDADLLIPGRGSPIENATLLAEDGVITYVGPTRELLHDTATPAESITGTTPQTHHESLVSDELYYRPDSFDRRYPLHSTDDSSIHTKDSHASDLRAHHYHVPVLMPGLWDAHVHYFGFSTYDLDSISHLSPALAGAKTARSLAATSNAGITSVRELGGYGIDIAPAVSSGWIPGPSIYSSGALISATAGHADNRKEPSCLLHDLQLRGLPLVTCDGVTECTKAVREQVRRGAKTIKLASTGGASSSDDIHSTLFSDAELSAIVEEASRQNLNVAAHAHGTAGIKAALCAGVNTIEHGSWLTPSSISLMKKQGTTLIATRSILEWSKAHPEAWDPVRYKKVLELERANLDSYKAAINAGVKIALGTDLGISSLDTKFQHGTNGSEFGYAVEAGMTPLSAIEAGTANAAETLGTQAPKKGQLRVGFEADMIALDTNPLVDIWVLSKAEEVRFVWKGGVCVKSPGRDVGILP
ncbi:MAG: hypothetical protein Q9162_005499 [Coniocarpon cinnabarinum]